MKPTTAAALSVLTLAMAAPVLAQTGSQPRVSQHETIAIAEAFPELIAGKDRTLHARKLELPPGARTALIDRTGRPAITYVTRGEVLEHREGLAQPIRRSVRTATMDKGGVRHYWENANAEPAEILVVELAPTAQE